MSMVIRCPKCGAGEDSIQTEQRTVVFGRLMKKAFDGRLCVMPCDSDNAGPVWVTCLDCGYRTKSLSVKTWMQEVDA